MVKSPGSSKRPPQGPRKEPRAVAAGAVAAEGVDADDDIDSDEEKRLRATDLGIFQSACCIFDYNRFHFCDRFHNRATICRRRHHVRIIIERQLDRRCKYSKAHVFTLRCSCALPVCAPYASMQV